MKAGLVVTTLVALVSASSAFGSRSARLNRKFDNLILERPVKQSKGLFEKPLFIENAEIEDESDEIEDATRSPSWLNRVWQNAFGTVNEDPFTNEHDHSHESEEFEGFFASLKPWWKGPNVCNSESDYFVRDGVSADVDSSFFTFLMTTCHDAGRSYKCTKRTKVNSTVVRVHSLTYECCLGYARDPRSRLGCPKKLDLQNMTSVLRAVNATKLAGALEDANLAALVDEGNVTLFAPSDNAMTSNDGQDGINVVVLETADKMQFARDILQSHIVAGTRVYSSDEFEDEMILPTVSNGAGIRINIFRRPTPFATANCARVVSGDYRTSNGGYLHVIDRVLTPVKRSLWQMTDDDPRFSVMRSLIDENTKRRLADPKEHLTLLAFTDDTFEALPAEMRQRIREKDSCFNNFLLHHILPHTICTAAVVDERGYVRNLASRLMNATRSSDDTVSFADRKVTMADQMATNGVMHIIDGIVLVPEMLDIIGALELSNGAAATFASALRSNNIAATLSNGQPMTVFVPPAEFISTLTADDLRNHIVLQSILDRFRVVLNRPKTLTTNAGRNISIRFEYTYASLFDWDSENRLRLHVGCARAEKIATSCNGVIVFLDKPLFTASKTAFDLVKSKPELSEFVSLIDKAGLADTLKSSQLDATVLAPTNEALSHFLIPEEKRRLLKSQDLLRRFVKEHILLGNKCCNDLAVNDWFSTNYYTTMAGTMVSSVGRSPMTDLRIGGAGVEQCDLVARNGIVHAIDGIVRRRRRSLWPSHWNRFDLFDE